MTERQVINSLIKKEKPIGKLSEKNIINIGIDETLIIHPEIIKVLNDNGFVIMKQAHVQQIINRDLEIAKELIKNYGNKED
jgi:hypothetical protein